MSHITIYTQDDCPPCTFVKNHLQANHVDFTEKNIKNNQFILLNDEPMYQVDMDKINQAFDIQ